MGPAFTRIWTLRRLKRLGTKTADLLDVYFKQVRSILELAVPLWHSSLTSFDRNRIERVQKSALGIILGRKYKSYNRALTYLKLDSLFNRREKLCRKFALKCEKNTKFKKCEDCKIHEEPYQLFDQITEQNLKPHYYIYRICNYVIIVTVNNRFISWQNIYTLQLCL